MPQSSYLFNQPPDWIIPRLKRYPTMPASIRSWVYEQGSLTKRLRTNYGSQFQVTLLQQHWQKPYQHESRLLGLPAAEFTLIREVLLSAEQVPLILARSIIPHATIQAANRNLAHIGNRPLGEIIFGYRDLQRLCLAITQIKPAHWTGKCRTAFELEEPIWGRRTIYAIPTCPLLVSEFFMPTLQRG